MSGDAGWIAITGAIDASDVAREFRGDGVGKSYVRAVTAMINEIERLRGLLADGNEWKSVAIANQATAQSHAERWSRAGTALKAIIDLGGAYGSRAWISGLIAREALAHTQTKEHRE